MSSTLVDPVRESHGALGRLRVSDAMHHGLVSCDSETPLRAVARMMATSRVHALLVVERDEKSPGRTLWGVVSDVDLLRLAQEERFFELTAGDVVGAPPLMVSAAEQLSRAAGELVRYAATHLIVTDPRTGKPVGVLSTLDVLRAAAGFPERHPWRQSI